MSFYYDQLGTTWRLHDKPECAAVKEGRLGEETGDF